MEPIIGSELQRVLHSFQKNNSPYPNRWMMEFFLGFYEILGNDLLRVIEDFCRFNDHYKLV